MSISSILFQKIAAAFNGSPPALSRSQIHLHVTAYELMQQESRPRHLCGCKMIVFTVFAITLLSFFGRNRAGFFGTFEGIPELPELPAGQRRDVFHHDQVIAIVDARKENETVRCDLLRV